MADATFQNIPFIGDLIDINDNEFLGSCLKEGCQSICRLHVDDHGFEVETDFTTAFDQALLTNDDAHVIIGMDLEMHTENNTIMLGSLFANMISLRKETLDFPVQTFVCDDKVKILNYHLIPEDKLVTFINNNPNLGKNLGSTGKKPTSDSDLAILKNIKIFQAFVDNLKRINKLLQDQYKLKQMSASSRKNFQNWQQELSDFKQMTLLECLDALHDLDMTNWFDKIYFFMDTIDYCRLTVRAIEEELLNYNNSSTNQPSLNYARCIRQGDMDKPKKEGMLLMPCPKSFNGQCLKECQPWACTKCQSFLYYGFNDHLYCKCSEGKGTNIQDFEFKCIDLVAHGPDYAKFDNKCKDYFHQIQPVKEISVAILGQTGVGKSTWINGIVNYLQYDSMEDAKNSTIITAVPTIMHVTDDNYQTKIIKLGHDDNENTTEVGASGTQECRTYCIRYNDYKIQLIDTPGMGDTRGIEHDKKSVKNILNHLRHYKELNGICILLKPNESKISVLMEYCMKEILTHLHKACTKNIVFCFTNSRSTFYRPGETLPVLKVLLENTGIDIPLNKDTIYCIDNEAYRFLCTVNSKELQFTESEEKDFEQSWNKSVEETKRLWNYVIQLKPHCTQDTIVLNQAKRMVLSLNQPIADITHNIDINLQIVADHKKHIEELDENDKELLKKLYVPQITLEALPLGYPRTVCTSDTCVEYHILPETGYKTTVYVNHCHAECYLQNVIVESFPNPALKDCYAFLESNGDACRECKCSWETHMHITYEQKRSETRVTDKNIEKSIGPNSNLKKQKQKIIDDLEKQISVLNEEKKKIISIATKFACFLKKHAITPYNDSFCEYLEYLIDREERKEDKTKEDKAILENLKKTRETYLGEMDILKQAMDNASGLEDYDVDDVKKWQEELYQLPIHGKQLKDNIKIILEAEDNAAKQTQKDVTAPASSKNDKGLMSKIKQKFKNLFTSKKSTK